MLIAILITAIWLDHRCGEPSKYHLLIGFGNIATSVELYLNKGNQPIIRGGFATIMLITPPAMLGMYLFDLLSSASVLRWAFDSLILYWAIGHRSLCEHVSEVQNALRDRDIKKARTKLSYIVSRETNTLSTHEVLQATIETGLENGNDSVFAPLFWYCFLGSPAVIVYRLINTLDAMWGYRNQRFEKFGKAAARLDDALNYVPARLVAITYALLGNAQLAFTCWHTQARTLNSPNAGPVMSAGAGSLGVSLGGPAFYNGKLLNKPNFGGTSVAHLDDIQRCLDIVTGGLLTWCLVIGTFVLLW